MTAPSMHHLKRHDLEAQSAPLRLAAELGDLVKVQALVTAGADIDAGGKHGVTALHRATEREREDVVRFLLQAGADHSKKTNRSGQTALMMCAQRGNGAICEMLVQAGADVNAKSANGWSAIMFASARRHQDIVLLLARANGDVERCSHGGVNATDLLAVWHGDTRTADRAQLATHNSSRAREQMRLWSEERARQAAQIGDTDTQDLERPSDSSAGTPRSDDFPTPQVRSPLLASPRDVESDVRLLLAAGDEQRRQQEEARIDSLLQRSRQHITFEKGGRVEGTASTQLQGPPTDSTDEWMTTTPLVASVDETAAGNVNTAGSDAAAQDLTAPTIEPVRATTSTVRDQDQAQRQQDRRARIEAMRQELHASLGS